jgi:hypothetical protein
VPTGSATATPMGAPNVPSTTGFAKLLSTSTSSAPEMATNPKMPPSTVCTVATGIDAAVSGAALSAIPVFTMWMISSGVPQTPSGPGKR